MSNTNKLLYEQIAEFPGEKEFVDSKGNTWIVDVENSALILNPQDDGGYAFYWPSLRGLFHIPGLTPKIFGPLFTNT